MQVHPRTYDVNNITTNYQYWPSGNLQLIIRMGARRFVHNLLLYKERLEGLHLVKHLGLSMKALTRCSARNKSKEDDAVGS